MPLWDGALWHTILTWAQASVNVMAVLGALGAWYVARRLERYKASLTADNERLKADMAQNNERFKADMQQQLERLKGDVHVTAEKALYMHKMQLDAERDIYQELWSKLLAVRAALQRIAFYKAQPEPTLQDWPERRSQFDTAVRELAEVAERQRPFFAARITGDLFDLLALAYEGVDMTETEKAREMQGSGPRRKSVSYEVTRNLGAIERAVNQLCESIRERLTGTESAIQ